MLLHRRGASASRRQQPAPAPLGVSSGLAAARLMLLLGTISLCSVGSEALPLTASSASSTAATASATGQPQQPQDRTVEGGAMLDTMQLTIPMAVDPRDINMEQQTRREQQPSQQKSVTAELTNNHGTGGADSAALAQQRDGYYDANKASVVYQALAPARPATVAEQDETESHVQMKDSSYGVPLAWRHGDLGHVDSWSYADAHLSDHVHLHQNPSMAMSHPHNVVRVNDPSANPWSPQISVANPIPPPPPPPPTHTSPLLYEESARQPPLAAPQSWALSPGAHDHLYNQYRHTPPAPPRPQHLFSSPYAPWRR